MEVDEPALEQLVRDCVDLIALEKLYLSCDDEGKRIIKRYSNKILNSALKYRK